jgi:hypothetical protein
MQCLRRRSEVLVVEVMLIPETRNNIVPTTLRCKLDDPPRESTLHRSYIGQYVDGLATKWVMTLRD